LIATIKNTTLPILKTISSKRPVVLKKKTSSLLRNSNCQPSTKINHISVNRFNGRRFKIAIASLFPIKLSQIIRSKKSSRNMANTGNRPVMQKEVSVMGSLISVVNAQPKI
jgi:hypothetical protein